MKFINEISPKHLQDLKDKALEKHKEKNKNAFLEHFVQVIVLIFLIPTGVRLITYYKADNSFGFIAFSIGLIVLSCLTFSLLVKMRKNYHAWRNPLDDIEKENVYATDEDVCTLLKNLNLYSHLDKAEILSHAAAIEMVLISYTKKDGTVEKIGVCCDVQSKKGLTEPILTLTENGFVFCEPYIDYSKNKITKLRRIYANSKKNRKIN